MPIYEYMCNKCKKQFALLQSLGTTEGETRCPECDSNEVKKVLSAFSCSSHSSISSPSASFSGGG